MTPKYFTSTALVQMPLTGEWIVWDGEPWYRYDDQAWNEIATSYAKIGFDSHLMFARDSTPMIVLISSDYGVRVFSTRA